MATGANILRFPVTNDRMLCHVTVPNAVAILRNAPDDPTGMSGVAVGMQHVAERFDDLAIIFEECSEAKYVPSVVFLEGRYTFVVQIPRRYKAQLIKMGWNPEDIDVPPEKTVLPDDAPGKVPV